MITSSFLVAVRNEPHASVVRPYEPKGIPEGHRPLTRFLISRVTVQDGQPVSSITEAEDRLLSEALLIQLPPPQPIPEPVDQAPRMTAEQQKAWRVVAYANRATKMIAEATKRPGPFGLLVAPTLAAMFGSPSEETPPKSYGRWTLCGHLGVLPVWSSDALPEDTFVVAVMCDPTDTERPAANAAVVVTAEDGSLHMVTDIPLEGETPLCTAAEYLVRYRF